MSFRDEFFGAESTKCLVGSIVLYDSSVFPVFFVQYPHYKDSFSDSLSRYRKIGLSWLKINEQQFRYIVASDRLCTLVEGDVASQLHTQPELVSSFNTMLKDHLIFQNAYMNSSKKWIFIVQTVIDSTLVFIDGADQHSIMKSVVVSNQSIPIS